MSTPTKPKADAMLGLSHTDAKILIWGIFCITDQGKIDYDKLAEKAGYKNGASASVTYRNARKNFLSVNAGDADVTGTAAETPTKKTPNKRKANGKAGGGADAEGDEGTESAAAANGGAEGGETSTPKRQRKTPTKKGTAVKVTKKKGQAKDADNEGEGDGENEGEDTPVSTPTKPKRKSNPKSKTAMKGATAVKQEGDEDEELALTTKTNLSAGMELPGDSSVEREIEDMDDGTNAEGSSVAAAA
ncbi:hypothetical protein PHISP_01551 [Aspergillus sp. HF37]|nr:hypothetical protein PHISP_01551 [Aspergillus sp. HF37]